MANEQSVNIFKLLMVTILLLVGIIFGMCRMVHIMHENAPPLPGASQKVMDMQFGDSHFQLNALGDNEGVVFSAEKKPGSKKHFQGPWWENKWFYFWGLFVWLLAVCLKIFIEALLQKVVINRWKNN